MGTEFVNIILTFHVSNDIQAWEPNTLTIWSVILYLCVFSVEPKKSYCALNVRRYTDATCVDYNPVNYSAVK